MRDYKEYNDVYLSELKVLKAELNEMGVSEEREKEICQKLISKFKITGLVDKPGRTLIENGKYKNGSKVIPEEVKKGKRGRPSGVDWTPEVIERIKTLQQEGKSLREISGIVEIHLSSIWLKLKELGLTGSKKKPARKQVKKKITKAPVIKQTKRIIATSNHNIVVKVQYLENGLEISMYIPTTKQLERR